MKTILLTKDGLEHRYVLNSLELALGEYLCGVYLESNEKQIRLVTKFKRVRNIYSTVQMLERITTKIIRKILRFDERQEKALIKILGTNCMAAKPANYAVSCGTINGEEIIKWIECIGPDLIFVYGTSIVSQRVLSLAKVSLNLHTGLSPYYRGSDAHFWPLYNGELQKIGATVHDCTSDIDGGNIYSRVSVRVEEDDDPFSVFARCVKAGAITYSKVARSFVEGRVINVQKQDLSLGRMYRFRDRTFVNDLRMEFLIRSGKLKSVIHNLHKSNLQYPDKDIIC